MVEVATSTALMVVLVGAATSLFGVGSNLSQTTKNASTALTQLDHTIAPLADFVRRGSISTLRKLDDTPFADGETDRGLRIGIVTDYANNQPVVTTVQLEWDVPAGATEGELIQRDGPLVTTYSSRVTNFTVERVGTAVRFNVEAAAGPTNDRRRTATAVYTITPRNN